MWNRQGKLTSSYQSGTDSRPKRRMSGTYSIANCNALFSCLSSKAAEHTAPKLKMWQIYTANLVGIHGSLREKYPFGQHHESNPPVLHRVQTQEDQMRSELPVWVLHQGPDRMRVPCGRRIKSPATAASVYSSYKNTTT